MDGLLIPFYIILKAMFPLPYRTLHFSYPNVLAYNTTPLYANSNQRPKQQIQIRSRHLPGRLVNMTRSPSFLFFFSFSFSFSFFLLLHCQITPLRSRSSSFEPEPPSPAQSSSVFLDLLTWRLSFFFFPFSLLPFY